MSWTVFAEYKGNELSGAIILPWPNYAKEAGDRGYTVELRDAVQPMFSTPDGTAVVAAVSTFDRYSGAEDFSILLRRIVKIGAEVKTLSLAQFLKNLKG